MTSHPDLLTSALLAAGLVLAGCGTSSASKEAVAPGDPERARAVAIVDQLRGAGLPVDDVVVCLPPAPAPSGHPTPRAAAFDDTRVSTGTERHIISEGGVVEVYNSGAQARARERELDAQVSAAQAYGFDEGGHALHPERRFRDGSVLLRLSGDLPAEAARDYASALATTTASDQTALDDIQEAPCST